jgi:hypothetical protein
MYPAVAVLVSLGLLFCGGFSKTVAAANKGPVFWPAELTSLTPQYSSGSETDFIQWQQQQRQQLRQSYLWPDPLPKVQAERLSRSDQGRYWREKWRVQLLTPDWQQLWLLIPKTASAAAIARSWCRISAWQR